MQSHALCLFICFMLKIMVKTEKNNHNGCHYYSGNLIVLQYCWAIHPMFILPDGSSKDEITHISFSRGLTLENHLFIRILIEVVVFWSLDLEWSVTQSVRECISLPPTLFCQFWKNFPKIHVDQHGSDDRGKYRQWR